MDQPEISIIVPVYNGRKYLKELSGQFRLQRPSCFEMIFVDDGSHDGTGAALEKYKSRESFPITVFHQENQGVSAARNMGMELAHGRYITFIDVDDAVSPDYIQSLHDCIKINADVYVFLSRRVRQAEKNVPAKQPDQPGPKPVGSITQLHQFIEDPTKLGIYNLLLKRSFLASYTIRYAVGYKYYEDYDFLLQVFAQADKIEQLNKILYDYILREGSAMNRFTADRINCLRLMKEKEKWLDEKAPDFAPEFRRWFVARLYWSVLWQAALTFPTLKEFEQFASYTGAPFYLKKLSSYPDRLVRISSRVFLVSRPLYRLAVQAAGRSRSRVETVHFRDIRKDFHQHIDYYRD